MSDDDSIFSARPGVEPSRWARQPAAPRTPGEPVDVTPGEPIDLSRGEPIDLTRGEPIDVTPAPRPARFDFDDIRRGPSRGRKIAIGVGLAVGVAALGVLGVFGAGIWSEKDATLTLPDEVAGLNRNTSEQAETTADDLRSAFAAGIDLDESVGAVYADPAAADRSVLLFGGTTLLWSPERDLDTLFELVADDDAGVAGLHEVPSGSFGGVMKCGETPGDGGTTIPVCGWADHGSVAIGLFPGRPVAEAGDLMREMREVVQSRD